MSATGSILEIPEVRARVSPLSVEQYHQLPEFNTNGRRTELIRGVLIEKISKSPLHSGVASTLYDLLRPLVPAGFWLRKEEPLTLRDSEPEPDLSLVPGAHHDYAARHPASAALVIEVAVSTAAEDRALADLYAEAGVEEYWIVLPVERRVEVYRRPQAGAYLDCQVVEAGVTIVCASLPSIRLHLSDLF